MQIRVALLPQLAGDTSNAVCIVIDVLRATSVIATLFDRGCPIVFTAPSHDLARSFAGKRGYCLCGETAGEKEPDFDYGNSPIEFSKLDFTNRPVVISTTNGTRAVAAVASAPVVLLGAAINRMAVARAAWMAATQTDANTRDIVIVCSGTDRQFTLEDATVAGIYVEAIHGMAGPWTLPDISDSAIACRRLWQTEPNIVRGWMEGVHARNLGDRGYGEDIGYCAALDVMDHVPTLVSSESDSDLVGIPKVACPVMLVNSSSV